MTGARQPETTRGMIGQNFPKALQPFYRTRKPNSDVLLHRGRLQLEEPGGGVAEGDGFLRLCWLPVPRIAFSLQPSRINNKMRFLTDPTLRLRLLDRGVSASAVSSGPTDHGGAMELEGSLRGPLEPIEPCVCARVIFHVEGFWDMQGSPIRWSTKRSGMSGRVALRGGDWNITLDPVRELDGPNGLASALRGSRGYAITHVGAIEKQDAAVFDRGAAEQILRDIGCYLSFARGAWCMPVLPVGLDAQGKRCWEDWKLKRIDPYVSTMTWCGEDTGDALGAAFPGFLSRRASSLWRMPVELAINWYVESCSANVTVDTAMVIEQTALELLAWVLKVEDEKSASASDFEKKYPAWRRLTLLLQWAGIPSDIPAQMPELAAWCQKAVTPSGKPVSCDGPHAFTMMRNQVAHAKTGKSLLATATKARRQAKMLGLWYLGLILLRLFDHNGRYLNALVDHPHGGKIEQVPWANQT